MLKWGIVGLGKIAHSFANDLSLLKDHDLVSVASRSLDKARVFASEYNVPTYFGDYSSMFSDADIDIVYIATPHNSHTSLSIEALNAKKHVLCEKPIGVNYSEVKEMIKTSHNNNAFLMEALWTRFNPSIKKILELVAAEKIGTVNYINADFCFPSQASPESRLFNMSLAGGALLDIGIYPIFLSYLILGLPNKISATAKFHNTGADIQTAMILTHKKAMANLTCSFQAESDMSAKICGTEGMIKINPRWHHTEGFTIVKEGVSKEYSYPIQGRGYTYEIEECAKCIQNKQLESQLWSHQNSLEIASILDKVRSQIGLRYPFD